MSGAVLDTGALVAFERSDRRVVAIVKRAVQHGDTLFIPAGVIAQAWRDGTRQARLARLLGSSLCQVVVLDDYGARAAGQLCGATRTSDIVDSSVVIAARQRNVRIITSDPDDLRRLDRYLDLVAI
jgi:PIN domain